MRRLIEIVVAELGRSNRSEVAGCEMLAPPLHQYILCRIYLSHTCLGLAFSFSVSVSPTVSSSSLPLSVPVISSVSSSSHPMYPQAL